jgi:hypothetical protein
MLSVGLYVAGTHTPNKPLVWQLSLMGMAWLCAALSGLQFLRHLPAGKLDFDGVDWYFHDNIGHVSVRFDGQSCLLLRFEDDLNKAYWLWLEASFDPNHWLEVRRAVYSRAEVSKTSPNLI